MKFAPERPVLPIRSGHAGPHKCGGAHGRHHRQILAIRAGNLGAGAAGGLAYAGIRSSTVPPRRAGGRGARPPVLMGLTRPVTHPPRHARECSAGRAAQGHPRGGGRRADFFGIPEEIGQAVDCALAEGAMHVLIDMLRVGRIDLSGARRLVLLRERNWQAGVALVMTPLRPGHAVPCVKASSSSACSAACVPAG